MPYRRYLGSLFLPIAMISVSIVSGCAFSNIPVTLPTQPTSGYSGGDNRVLTVPKFIDQREIKDRIGMQKNGYGMDTANAIADQSVDGWLAARLAAELQAVGFKIVGDGAHPKATKIQGYVLKMFTEPVQQWSTMDLETDLAVRIQLSRPDDLEAERRYFIKGLEQGLISLSGAFNGSVNKASDALMKRLVPDIINLLNKYPEK
jgi:hypothetical protein